MLQNVQNEDVMTKTATFHDLEGASVFITGGGSGIGASLTEGFLAQGSKVTFIGRSDATEFAEEVGEKYNNKMRSERPARHCQIEKPKPRKETLTCQMILTMMKSICHIYTS